MISSVGVNGSSNKYCVVESDNCTSQYKSRRHFSHMQDMAEETGMTIIRVYGIAGHGKGEVDHVGGIVKTAVRREVANGTKSFYNSYDVVKFVDEKFSSNDDLPTAYIVKEVHVNELEVMRNRERRSAFTAMRGSSKFQVMVFSPDRVIRAAPRLCICDMCKIKYGSCSIFTSYPLERNMMNKVSLRSNEKDESSDEEKGHDDDSDEDDDEEDSSPENSENNDFLIPGTICVVRAYSKTDKIWFFKINDEVVDADEYSTDDSNHTVHPGQNYYSGNFLEQTNFSKKGRSFKVSKKVDFVYRTSIVYPLVEFESRKDELFLPDQDYVGIMIYLEQNGFNAL